MTFQPLYEVMRFNGRTTIAATLPMIFRQLFAQVVAVCLFCAWALTALGNEVPSGRRAILNAAEQKAAELAGQSVRFQIDRFNVDQGWAIVVGKVKGVKGKRIDWSLTECDAGLDKMLWVVLHKGTKAWQVEQIELCASEPPYWYLDQSHGLVWPCGVYAGLTDGGNDTLQARCHARRRRIE